MNKIIVILLVIISISSCSKKNFNPYTNEYPNAKLIYVKVINKDKENPLVYLRVKAEGKVLTEGEVLLAPPSQREVFNYPVVFPNKMKVIDLELVYPGDSTIEESFYLKKEFDIINITYTGDKDYLFELEFLKKNKR